MRSSTKIAIPILDGVYGNIEQYPFTRNGCLNPTKINWITPMEVQYPDGWGIFKLKTVPTLQRYESQFEFEIWDQYMRSKPKLVGKVKVDADNDSYFVELEPRYKKFKLSMLLTLHYQPQEPFESFAFRNKTPYGEWQYKDVI